MNLHRFFSSVLSLCLYIALIGCGPGHRAIPVEVAGRPLHLSVSVPKDQAASASGTVYFSMPARTGSYTAIALERRGSNLVATLPTQGLAPGERVAYYFEVYLEGEAKSLRSPQSPYVTEFLDQDAFVQRSLRFDVACGAAHEEVVFLVSCDGEHTISHAHVSYSPPDLAGVIEQPMVKDGRAWRAVVPANRVVPGAWTYRITAEVDGKVYTQSVQPNAWSNFTVEPKKP